MLDGIHIATNYCLAKQAKHPGLACAFLFCAPSRLSLVKSPALAQIPNIKGTKGGECWLCFWIYSMVVLFCVPTLHTLIMHFLNVWTFKVLWFLAWEGAQSWTGLLAVMWQVILPNRICFPVATILGMGNECMEGNSAYTGIAQVQPFRTQVSDRQSCT